MSSAAAPCEPDELVCATAVPAVSIVDEVLRGGTVSVGRIVSLGVLDCRDRRNVLSRLHRGLARRFTGLMA